MNTDGNTYAINEYLFSRENYGYAQEVIDQMTDKELMEYAEEWDIYVMDNDGEWINDGLEELYKKIEDNIDDFTDVFV